MSNLVEHAERELRKVGYNPDLGANGILDEMNMAIYTTTVEIVRQFASVGHSGGSAGVHTAMIHDLLQFKALSELTDNQKEWIWHDKEIAGGEGIWQSMRSSDCFSDDRLKTYYSVDEFRTGWRAKLFGKVKKRYPIKPQRRASSV
jgi:hypothetical protein